MTIFLKKNTSKTLPFSYRSHRWMAGWHMVKTYIIDYKKTFSDMYKAVDGSQKGQKVVKMTKFANKSPLK